MIVARLRGVALRLRVEIADDGAERAHALFQLGQSDHQRRREAQHALARGREQHARLVHLGEHLARDEGDVGTQVMHLRVSAGDSEYFDAAMRAPLLKRIAEETGGRFFTPSNVSSLTEAISYSGRGVTVVEERDLWDMPVVFVTLLGLMGGEWLYRRKWGMA